MEQVLYADILFLINFSMDFVTLYLTSRLTSGPPVKLRAALAAVLGGIYGTVATATGVDGAVGIILSGIVSAGMVALSFGIGGVRTLLRRCAVFWGAGALLGGVMTAVCSLGGTISPRDGKGSSAVILFGGSMMCTFIVKLISRFTKRHTASVRITLDGRTAEFTALCDSGNLVTDPLSAKPVIFADTSVVRRLIPDFDPSGEMIPDSLRTRLRVIPARSVGGGTSLTGFVPDEVCLIIDGKSAMRNAVIAVSDFGGTFFGGYPANVPAGLL